MNVVRRRLTAVVLSLALPGGALQAHLVHAHVDDPHGHGGIDHVVHAHFSGHTHDHHGGPAGVAPALHENDGSGRTAYLQMFQAAHTRGPADAGVPVGRFLPIRPLHQPVALNAPDVVRSHGPPDVRPGDPRAPPSFLS